MCSTIKTVNTDNTVWGGKMKKIKLLIILLAIMLSGCSVLQLEFGMNVNDFDGNNVPRIAMGIKAVQSKKVLFDLNYINLEIHYGSNGDFPLMHTEEGGKKFVGCILMACKPEERNIEFSKEQTSYMSLGDIECVYLSDIGNILTGPTIKINDKKVDYDFYTTFYVDNRNLVGSKGQFCIQMREVLYNTIDKYYYTGDIFEIMLNYTVKSNKVNLSVSGYTYIPKKALGE